MATRLAVRGIADDMAGPSDAEPTRDRFLSDDEIHAQFRAYQRSRPTDA